MSSFTYQNMIVVYENSCSYAGMKGELYNNSQAIRRHHLNCPLSWTMTVNPFPKRPTLHTTTLTISRPATTTHFLVL